MTYTRLRKFGVMIDAKSEDRVSKLIDFLHENGYTFYNMECPVIRESSKGNGNHFVDVTISIKLN